MIVTKPKRAVKKFKQRVAYKVKKNGNIKDEGSIFIKTNDPADREEILDKLSNRLNVPIIEIGNCVTIDKFPVSYDGEAICPHCGTSGVPDNYNDPFVDCDECGKQYGVKIKIETED